jgi:hypothetical protein
MQKIQSYLYPNRIILLANLAGFTVENTIVYQRTVKIYNGIDNTLEFDIQNADQKRIDLSGFSSLILTVMDQAGNELSNSPYTITPMAQDTHKGLASVVIPQDDLAELNDQSLKFSVTGVKNGADVILYTDSKFGAVGRMDLDGSAMPLIKDDRVYKDFAGEINYMGNVINHSPAIPTKTYEAEPTTSFDIEVDVESFIGTIYVEATRDMTISVNSFTNAPQLATVTRNTATTSTISFADLLVEDYNYFRVSWVYPDVWQFGSQSTLPFGSVTKVTVKS